MYRSKILALIDVARARGLEIGAQTRPVVTRDMGAVEYVDRATTAELRKWYENDPAIDRAALVEVDHVWGERTLLECVGGKRAFAYVIASHVLEHVPDLLGWLDEIAAVLIDGGIASFVVPDKRFTFDILRRTSSSSELVDAYLRRLRRPEPRQIFDHFHNHRDIGNEAVRRGEIQPSDLPPMHTPQRLTDICRHVLTTGEYLDAHCWVFTPRSFVEALDFANGLGLLPFEIAALYPTSANTDEFFVSLRRLPAAAAADERRAAFVASRQRLSLPPEGDELGAAIERARLAERQLEALHSSTSWRITAPLRRLVSAWRERRGGG